MMTLALPARAEVFHENLMFQVLVGDAVDPRAHIYDSEDFQEMLVVSGENAPLLLELMTDSVYELAREDLEPNGDELILKDDHGGLLVTALAKEEGSIIVDLEETTLKLAPTPPLVGVVELEDVIAVKPSYALDAEAYEPDTAFVSKLKTLDRPINVSVYFGTWCRLCKHLVPQFMGVVHAVDNPNLRVRYVGVSETRDEPAKWLVRYGIEKTPTILFLEGNGEIGRIEQTVEPSTTIEEAMTRIIFGS